MAAIILNSPNDGEYRELLSHVSVEEARELFPQISASSDHSLTQRYMRSIMEREIGESEIFRIPGQDVRQVIMNGGTVRFPQGHALIEIDHKADEYVGYASKKTVYAIVIDVESSSGEAIESYCKTVESLAQI